VSSGFIEQKMSIKVVIYDQKWFAEVEWLRRLLHGMEIECVSYATQGKVAENSLFVCLQLGSLSPRLLDEISQTRGVVLYHVGDEWYRQPTQAYRSFSHVIRNFYHPGLVHPGISQLPLGPCRDTRLAGAPRPILERKNIWSFAGYVTSTRAAMMNALEELTPHVGYAIGGVRTVLPLLEPARYLELLHDSMFAPCPMGNVNLECFRLYEALDSGAIPIVETRPWLNYFEKLLGPHPLPAVNCWSEAPGLMRALMTDSDALVRKQQEIRDWWINCQDRLRQDLTVILERAHNCAKRPLAATPLPGRWRGALELLRHHNGEALKTRVKLTCKRFLVR